MTQQKPFRPDKAFILAAGKGTRLRPYTDDTPKPMVQVGGKPMIDYMLDALIKAGVEKVAINLHYFGNKIEDHLKDRKDIQIFFSKEPVLLDTGGGIKNIARSFGDDAFYAINGDAFWTEGSGLSALERLANAWDESKMDILMMLQPVSSMTLTEGVGDYDIDAAGRAVRSLNKTGAYMFTSIRILTPRVFRGTPDTPFSFLDVMDKAQEQGRLYALVHEGEWHHISTPKDLDAVNHSLGYVSAGAA